LSFRADENQGMVEEALERWSRATCIDMFLAPDGQHQVLFTNDGFADAERLGQITGSWEASTIRIKTADMVSTSKGMFNQVQEDDMRRTVAHEIGHLMMKTNAHTRSGITSDDDMWHADGDAINEEALQITCMRRSCGCFQPE
jgi:hypothetical protein